MNKFNRRHKAFLDDWNTVEKESNSDPLITLQTAEWQMLWPWLIEWQWLVISQHWSANFQSGLPPKEIKINQYYYILDTLSMNKFLIKKEYSCATIAVLLSLSKSL